MLAESTLDKKTGGEGEDKESVHVAVEKFIQKWQRAFFFFPVPALSFSFSLHWITDRESIW